MGATYSNIGAAVEKSDIQETYGNPMMPMVFRTIADTTYGKGVMPWLGALIHHATTIEGASRRRVTVTAFGTLLRSTETSNKRQH